jgi:hypothetical protein
MPPDLEKGQGRKYGLLALMLPAIREERWKAKAGSGVPWLGYLPD